MIAWLRPIHPGEVLQDVLDEADAKRSRIGSACSCESDWRHPERPAGHYRRCALVAWPLFWHFCQM